MTRFLNLDTCLAIVLFPLLVAQILRVRKVAMQLPEPQGARSGRVGQGAARRILIMGDSSAAGVGVAHQSQALSPQLAQELADAHDIHWTLSAQNGATTADQDQLLNPLSGQQFDLVYVIFGVNDAKNLRPQWAWERDVTRLIMRLRDEFDARSIVFSGLPRIYDFPLLPNPLRFVLELRTRRFDRALRARALKLGCHHAAIEMRLDPAGMAQDGFHPGAPIYKVWAQNAAAALRPLL